MTYEEAIKKYGELEEWDKEPGKVMSWSGLVNSLGTQLFSFDGGKHVYNVFGGGKNELTEEEMAIFQKENPTMARLYLSNKD